MFVSVDNKMASIFSRVAASWNALEIYLNSAWKSVLLNMLSVSFLYAQRRRTLTTINCNAIALFNLNFLRSSMEWCIIISFLINLACILLELYLLYAKLEEEHGLARRAIKIYERATEAVEPEERYTVSHFCFFSFHLSRTWNLTFFLLHPTADVQHLHPAYR